MSIYAICGTKTKITPPDGWLRSVWGGLVSADIVQAEVFRECEYDYRDVHEWTFEEFVEYDESPSAGKIKAWVYVVKVRARHDNAWVPIAFHMTESQARAFTDMLSAGLTGE